MISASNSDMGLKRGVEIVGKMFTAALRVWDANEGGRHTPLFHGYRCHLRFDLKTVMGFDGVVATESEELIYPGPLEREVTVYCLGKDEHVLASRIKEGETFYMCEGAKVVASGKIKDVSTFEALPKFRKYRGDPGPDTERRRPK